MDDPQVVQHIKMGLAVVGTLLVPTLVWVSSLSYKTGAAKATLNGHTEDIAKLDEECHECRQEIHGRVDDVFNKVSDVEKLAANIDGKLDTLIRRNGLI